MTANLMPVIQQPAVDPERVMASVVKIVNQQAEIFTASPSGSHGTGFFIGVDPDSGLGLIYTNRHVTQSGAGTAQQLVLEFNTPQRRGEQVEARVLFRSLVHDFTVLTFDPKKLRRAVLDYPLRLAGPESPFYDYMKNERMLRMQPVFAVGNPFGSSNSFTDGLINTLEIDDHAGPFFQVSASINPGNSGGPLISALTGEVIGINTAKHRIGENMGYAVPISAVSREFGLWREQVRKGISPTAADMRLINFKIGVVSEKSLKLQGLHEQVGHALPGYWENYDTVLAVTDTKPGLGLERDDILLKLNDMVIGGHTYNLIHRLQRADVTAEVTVLRKGEVRVVEVSFPSVAFQARRQMVDYVLISGLFVSEMNRYAQGRIHPSVNSRVVVSGLVQTPEISFMSEEFPMPGTLIVAANFGGDDYPVESLLDLKNAINANRGKSHIKLRAYKANYVIRPDGTRQQLITPATGLPLLDGVLSTYTIPMTDVLTPMQFSLHRFRKNFRWGPNDGPTRDWRTAVRRDRLPSHCAPTLRPPQS